MNVTLVIKPSPLEQIEALGEVELETFLSSNDPNAVDLRETHLVHEESIKKVLEVMDKKGWTVTQVQRDTMTKNDVQNADLVVTIGGDGTFLHATNFIDEQPVLAVNSHTGRSVGFFCSVDADGFKKIIDSYKYLPRSTLPRIAIHINDEPANYLAINDVLFAHENPAATTRYMHKGVEFKGSGILICAAAGSTGWMYQEGGKVIPITNTTLQVLHRGVRNSTPTQVPSVEIISRCAEGKLYIDGHTSAIDISLGEQIRFQPGKPLVLIGDIATKQASYQ